MNRQNNSISMVTCRKRLAFWWFIGAGVLFTILMLQTLSGKYEIIIPGEGPQNKAKEAWSWFLPTVLPTLSLMIGVYWSDYRKDDKKITVDRSKYRFALGLSFAYLLFIGMIFFLGPFFNKSQLELMKLSTLGLAPLQGLVCLLVGKYFSSQETTQAFEKSHRGRSKENIKRKKQTSQDQKQKGNKNHKRR